MNLHKLLKRQLDRLNMNDKIVPSDLDQWQRFLDRINTAYSESDQERYMLERSMEVSSRELSELNSKLEDAQNIAKLGYWNYNRETGRIIWSKEIYKMLGYDSASLPPEFTIAMELVHPDDREKTIAKINQAFEFGEGYELEIQIKSSDEKYRWYYVIGQPKITQNKKIAEISGIMMDITTQKENDIKVNSLNEKLITSARRAGMADVATSILHNVGNILNSANVSLGLIQENINQSYFDKIFSIKKLLNENIHQLGKYLLEDEKGKLIPEYLISLLEEINHIRDKLLQETKNLHEYIEHIKDITAMQKALSGVSGLIENCFLPDLIDTSIKMCGANYEKYGIKLNLLYKDKFFILTDKTKFLQVLVNLIQNAKDSLLSEKNNNQKMIEITCQKNEKECQAIVCIKDNGIGINQEDLTRIFSFGFTTKPDGHGFGLHSSSLAIRELGGTLDVISDGLHQGATFMVILPLKNKLEGEGRHDKQHADYRY